MYVPDLPKARHSRMVSDMLIDKSGKFPYIAIKFACLNTQHEDDVMENFERKPHVVRNFETRENVLAAELRILSNMLLPDNLSQTTSEYSACLI